MEKVEMGETEAEFFHEELLRKKTGEYFSWR